MESYQFDAFFTNINYQIMTTSSPEVRIYFKMFATQIQAVCMVNCVQNPDITDEQINLCKEQAISVFHSRGFIENHVLTILFTDDVGKAKKILAGKTFYWSIDAKENKLMIYENQIENFYGLRERLEKHLEDVQIGSTLTISKHQNSNRIAVTLTLVTVNVIIYVISALMGGMVYNKGAFSVAFILNGNHQYYRLFSSMFLHASPMHLMGNMILLFAVGTWVERYCGSVSYAMIYFGSGLIGSAFSAVGEIYTGSYVLSVGASGAIMGLIGSLLAIVVLHKGSYKEITTGRILFMIGYIIYSGLTTSNVNNLAHIGGVMGGFFMTVLFLKLRKAISS